MIGVGMELPGYQSFCKRRNRYLAIQNVGRNNGGRFPVGLFRLVNRLRLRFNCEEFFRTLNHSNPRPLVVNLLVSPFGIDLSPAFAVQPAGYLAKKSLVGVKPIDLIELGLMILDWTAIKVFAVFDETPRPDLKSPSFRRPFIKNDLIVNETTPLIVEMIELNQIDKLVDRIVTLR